VLIFFVLHAFLYIHNGFFSSFEVRKKKGTFVPTHILLIKLQPSLPLTSRTLLPTSIPTLTKNYQLLPTLTTLNSLPSLPTLTTLYLKLQPSFNTLITTHYHSLPTHTLLIKLQPLLPLIHRHLLPFLSGAC